MNDALNRPMSAGDFIAYAMTSGRSARMAFYQILAIENNGLRAQKFYDFGDSGQKMFYSPSVISGGNRAVLIPESALDSMK